MMYTIGDPLGNSDPNNEGDGNIFGTMRYVGGDISSLWQWNIAGIDPNAVGPGGDNNVTGASIIAAHMRWKQKLMAQPHVYEMDDSIAYQDASLKQKRRVDFPQRPKYSRKVFLGGLPYDITETTLLAAFSPFGPLGIDWPDKIEWKTQTMAKGFAFLRFQQEQSVQKLIDACITDAGRLYYRIDSYLEARHKPIQVRPWCLSDADHMHNPKLPLDPRLSVFIGGVPRPMKARQLAKIMQRMYGSVCFASIDVDAVTKYPKGAGRVYFGKERAYIAAISTTSLKVQYGFVYKQIEVKPFILDNQVCDECAGALSPVKSAPYFCMNVKCLKYYCDQCWAAHAKTKRGFHKPLFKGRVDFPYKRLYAC